VCLIYFYARHLNCILTSKYYPEIYKNDGMMNVLNSASKQLDITTFYFVAVKNKKLIQEFGL